MKVFLDTNVVIDFVCKRGVGKKRIKKA